MGLDFVPTRIGGMGQELEIKHRIPNSACKCSLQMTFLHCILHYRGPLGPDCHRCQLKLRKPRLPGGKVSVCVPHGSRLQRYMDVDKIYGKDPGSKDIGKMYVGQVDIKSDVESQLSSFWDEAEL
ncbi:hypothetical protein AVEN_107362-1 [Araneus ventricosus]|uniref:Uncharacterized protein n=1 Tax=Araneus ventricosus TaxID=182803 RepID=A0A4Y2QP82_ARAVE|nr:hypothetical protein AVEN_107362-1 [Araneus ventricosus]